MYSAQKPWIGTTPYPRYANVLISAEMRICAGWQQKNMPAHKIKKNWKFKISEIDEWVNNG